MDLARMLEKCRREQWRPEDVAFEPPRAMSREQEERIVQYFTDMAAIERLAGALFAAERDKVDDPVLKEIFTTFVIDEERHSEVARRLARHYDVHRYREYRTNPNLERFAPYFVDAIRYLSAEVANVYITTGELILDIALLRSIVDHVDDDTARGALAKINRDESRHVAIDFHMVEYYVSPAWTERVDPPQPLRTQARAWWAFGRMLWTARPFFRDVFFEPMDALDPSGRRIKEAFKRIQLLSAKPAVAHRPFPRFMLTVQRLFEDPVIGRIFGRVLARVAGVDPRVLHVLYSDAERERASTMSFEQMAEEALAAKTA